MGFEEDLRFVAFTLTRFTSFSANALLFGLVPILLLVVRPVLGSLDERWETGRRRIAARLEGIVRAVLVASAGATAITLLLQTLLASSLRDEDIGRASFESVLETTFGKWYALRLPILAALALLLVGRVRLLALPEGPPKGKARTFVWVGWGALALTLLATSTFSGHASVTSPRLVALITDVLHLAASAVWFSGLVVLAVVLPDAWRGLGTEHRLSLLAPSIVRFSNIAVVAIAVIAFTGTGNSFLQVEAASDLVDSGYGRTLALKILLFSAILAAGAVNHFAVRRRLEKARDRPATTTQRMFRKAIAIELALALGVMALTGVLTGLARTRQSGAAVEAVSVSFSRST